MNRDKQIEEMAKALTSYEYSLCERLPKDKCLLTSAIHAQVSCDYCKIAEFLVGKGYRKASDVAREIFEEIEKNMVVFGDATLSSYFRGIGYKTFAELKEKYESEGEQHYMDNDYGIFGRSNDER